MYVWRTGNNLPWFSSEATIRDVYYDSVLYLPSLDLVIPFLILSLCFLKRSVPGPATKLTPPSCLNWNLSLLWDTQCFSVVLPKWRGWLSTPLVSQSEKAEFRSSASGGATNQSCKIPLSLEVQVFQPYHIPLSLVLRVHVDSMDSSLIFTKHCSTWHGLPFHATLTIILGDILSMHNPSFIISQPSHLQLSFPPLYFSHPLLWQTCIVESLLHLWKSKFNYLIFWS